MSLASCFFCVVIGTLVDHARHLARLFVELAVCSQQVHKRRLAAVLRATRAMQPLAQFAAVVAAHGVRIQPLLLGDGGAQLGRASWHGPG